MKKNAEHIQKLSFVILLLFLLSPLVQLGFNLPRTPEALLLPSYGYSRLITLVIAADSALICVVWAKLFSGLSGSGTPLSARVRDLLPAAAFLALFLWTLLSNTVNGWTHAALYGSDYRSEGNASWFSYLLVFFPAGMLLTDRRLRRILLDVHLSISLLFSILLMIDEWIVPFPFFVRNGPSIVFQQFNHYGYFLTVSILAAYGLFLAGAPSRRRGVFYALCFACNTVALILNDTLGCYLAVVVVLIASFPLLWRLGRTARLRMLRLAAVFALITLVMSFFYGTILTNFLTLTDDIQRITDNPEEADSAGTGRWRLWKSIFPLILQKPILGHGTEGTSDALLEITRINERPHNEYLQYAAFYGFPGLLMYVTGCAVSLFRSWRVSLCRTTAGADPVTYASILAAAGYLVSAFFGNTMYYTTPYVYLFLGLGYAEYRKK